MGRWNPYAADPPAPPSIPRAPAVEGVGQEALGTGGTDTGRYYRLKSAISGGNVCLDVEGKALTNGARVLQWTCSGTGENQRWYARQISSTPDYQLSAKHSAKCLRVRRRLVVDRARAWSRTSAGTSPARPGWC